MTKAHTGGASLPSTSRLWVGPLVWAAHFLAIYGFTALACERNVAAGLLGVGIVVWFIGAATLVAAAVLLVTIGLAVIDGTRTSLPEPSGFVHWLTAAIGSLVLLAVVWEALPILLVPVCG